MNMRASRPTNAPAGETLEFRMVTHVTFFPDGTVCTVSFASVSDYTKGAGSFTLYPIVTFEDSSVLWIKSTGTGTVDGEKTRFVGTLTVVGGKGRFEGATGEGTLTGTRYTPLSVGADLVSDYVVKLTR